MSFEFIQCRGPVSMLTLSRRFSQAITTKAEFAQSLLGKSLEKYRNEVSEITAQLKPLGEVDPINERKREHKAKRIQAQDRKWRGLLQKYENENQDSHPNQAALVNNHQMQHKSKHISRKLAYVRHLNELASNFVQEESIDEAIDKAFDNPIIYSSDPLPQIEEIMKRKNKMCEVLKGE